MAILFDPTSTTQILNLANEIGSAYSVILTQIDPTQGGGLANELVAARDASRGNGAGLSGAAYTNLKAVSDSIDTAQQSSNTLQQAFLDSIPTALNTYVLAETLRLQSTTGGQVSFRTWYDGTTTAKLAVWSSGFARLWARVRQEELVRKIGSITKSSGSWTPTNPSIPLDVASKLEFRAGSTIGGSDITVTATCYTVLGTSIPIGVTVPAGTTIGTRFAIASPSGTAFVNATLSATGGTNADEVDLWVAP